MKLEKFKEDAKAHVITDDESIAAIFKAFGELPSDNLFNKTLRWKKQPEPIIREKLGLSENSTIADMFAETYDTIKNNTYIYDDSDAFSRFTSVNAPVEYFSQIAKGYLDERRR